MFSPNQIYDYLHYYCTVNEKNASVRYFKVNGVKDLSSLIVAREYYNEIDESRYLSDFSEVKTNILRETTGFIDMFDQEPIDTGLLLSKSYDTISNKFPSMPQIALPKEDFIFALSAGIYAPIICHSEKNSNDVKKYNNNFHLDVFFWSNAILSRYWFSQFELLQRINTTRKKRFGLYIRESNGTRKYRKDIFNFVKHNIAQNIHFPALNTNTIEQDIPPYASASIEWPDHTKFDIQIVAETLFNTEKIHLTEKIFKPIVMYQSFILFGPARSLEFLRSYGFKTFHDIWDESYDYEINDKKRFKKITDLLLKINSMSQTEYSKLITKTQEIIKFNRKYFYSEKFKNLLLNELNSNLEHAFEIRDEMFYTFPGGTLFYYYNKYYKITGKEADKGEKLVDLKRAYHYANSKSNTVGKEILKKYSHLLN